jgi:hypothetical protein
MRNKLALLFVIIFSYFSFPLTGQKFVNTPFSRFNIGTLEPAGSFRSLSMGGIGTAIRDNSTIFFTNPASYSGFDTTSFLFDFGLDYSMTILKSETDTAYSGDMNFDHLLMGFPVMRGFGVAVGVFPISNGYYKITDSVLEGDPEYDPLTGEYSEIHTGEGGFNKVFIGSGIKITPNFSAGVNLSILFGSLKRTNQFDFLSDYFTSYNNNRSERLLLSGINFDYGLQYMTVIKKDYFFNAGISYSSSMNCRSDYENIAFTYNAYGTIDTLSNYRNDTTKAFMPGTLRLGISFGKKDKLTVGLDYISTKWSDALFYSSEGSLADTRALLFGAELIPEKLSNYSFFKRMEYRIGGHIEDNYLILDGERIKEWGLSLGFGIPMQRSLSKTNLFFDFTRKSNSAGPELIRENFITMGVSLNLYDWWFVKRKYD